MVTQSIRPQFSVMVRRAAHACLGRDFLELLTVRDLLRTAQLHDDCPASQQDQILAMLSEIEGEIEQRRPNLTDEELVELSREASTAMEEFHLGELLPRALVNVGIKARRERNKSLARYACRTLDRLGEHGLARELANIH